MDQNTQLLVWPDRTQSFTEYYLSTHLNIHNHFMKSTFEVKGKCLISEGKKKTVYMIFHLFFEKSNLYSFPLDG